jgi:PAS domain S-box-containing protein
VFYHHLINLLKPPHFQDEEQNRIAAITQVIAIATLCGMFVILGDRIILGAPRLLILISIVSSIILASLILIRRGHLKASGSLLLWMLLAFSNYLVATNDGLHDTAILIIPGVLVIAGAIFSRNNFLFYTVASLLSIVAIGYLEFIGLIQNDYSSKTNFIDIVDMVVILGITAFTIRLLSDLVIQNFSKALENEKRYHSLFEAANDAIFIMRGDRIIDCNIQSLFIFGCAERKELVDHTPWEYSPLLQPDGQSSKEKAWEIIQGVMDGAPHRFYWKHSRKNGSQFDADVSLNSLVHGNEKLIQAFVRDITEQNKADEALKASRDQLRTLAVKLDVIREEERRHIAREIHDQLGQILTGLKMNISWFSGKIAAEDELKKKTEYMIDLVDMAIQSVRKIATDLRPGVLDELGLEAAIEWQAQEFERQFGISCQLNIKKNVLPANQEFSTAAFRVFQEALTNIARHAEASLVQVHLAVEHNSLYLHIEDNGKGITEEQLHDRKSIGLMGMNERALQYGGEVVVSRAESSGTKVLARFPLKIP